MNKTKYILIFSSIFLAGCITTFFFEGEYRKLIRSFFKYFQGEHIDFWGKNFHLFGTWYFVLAFGAFCTLLAVFTCKITIRLRLLILAITVILFFLSSFITSYIDSTQTVAACTKCRNGVSLIHFNTINYDFHFIIALIIALLPGLFFFLKNAAIRNL